MRLKGMAAWWTPVKAVDTSVTSRWDAGAAPRGGCVCVGYIAWMPQSWTAVGRE